MMCYCGRWNLENFAAHMGQVKNWPLLDPEFIKASSSSLYVTKVEENHMNSEYDREKSRSYGAGQKLTPPRSGIYQGLLQLFICNKSWRKLCYMRLHAATCSDKVAYKRAKLRQNSAKCGKMRQNAAHVAMLRLLKETWGNSFSAIWAATEASKAAFFTEFQIKNVETYCGRRFFEKTNFSAPRQKGAISHTQNDPSTPPPSSYPSG